MGTSLVLTVPDMSCANCKAAVSGAVSGVQGVERVMIDLGTKQVEVFGDALDDAAIRLAIDEAGYEVAS